MLMTDWIHVISGFCILLSLALGVEASPIFVHPYWLFVTAFIGTNLLQFGFNKFCPMGLILKDTAMIVMDWIHAIAGVAVLSSLTMGIEASPIFVHQYWLFLAAFVGANLLQFGFTKFCPWGVILKAMGVQEVRECYTKINAPKINRD